MTLIDDVCSSRRGLKNSYELRTIISDFAAAARAGAARAATNSRGIGYGPSISIASINFFVTTANHGMVTCITFGSPAKR